jgi:hypothetical protein
MRLLTRHEFYRPGQTFRFYPISDAHEGSSNSDTRALERTVGTVADDPDARCVFVGDLVESIAPDDKRWNVDDVDRDCTDWQARVADWYAAKLANRMRPVIDKCWCVTDGNHEERFNTKYFTNLNLRALEKLGKTTDDGRDSTLYGGWSCITRVVFEDGNQHRCSLKVYQQHGWQSGRKKGAKINGLDDLMGYVEGCHIYLVAHSHDRLLTTKTRLGTNPSFTNLRAYDAYGAHTGSFLRTYQLNKVGYGERKGYPPTSIGPIYFNVTPTTDGVVIEGVQ